MIDPTDSTWQRSVKRKLDQVADAGPQAGGDVAARVEVENEVSALRETLARQQETIQDLILELDEERNAASTAASEAMSMILRLQREKAEVQMEFRQFKRFAEERIAHDQQELVALDDLLVKREQTVQSLAIEIKCYKHLLNELGIPTQDSDFDLIDGEFDYPQLRCKIPGQNIGNDCESSVLEKYTPTTLNHLQNLESRIYEMEAEKEVAVGRDRASIDENEGELLSGDGDQGSDSDQSARVYTIDAVHAVPMAEVSNEEVEEEAEMVRENGGDNMRKSVGEDRDIKKLYMRLQALEADRESMRQAIISMRTEKAQLVLLKEIAQQLCKEVPLDRGSMVKKQSSITKYSFAAFIKWVLSIVLWRKKASRIKYSFGHSDNNAGLLLLLDKSPHMNLWRRIMTTQG